MAPQITIRQLAHQLGQTHTIQRAFGFHLKLQTLDQIIWDMPVEYNPRLERTAGRAHCSEGKIELHTCFANGQASREHHIETFLHELAHIHQWLVYHTADHGADWWEMMFQLGQKPKRTHSITACRAASATARVSIEEMGL